jgi:hypothetical protein
MTNSGTNSGNEPIGTGEFGMGQSDVSPIERNYLLKDSNSSRNSYQFQGGISQLPPYP